MIARAIEIVRRGGVVAVATETFFGLCADAHSVSAVERIVRLKGRPETKPLALIAGDWSAVESLVLELPAAARALGERHWPGPLTLVLRARTGLPAAVTGGTGTVAVRIAGPSPALDLARAFGGALTATSANRAGEPPAETAEQALRIFGAEVDLVVAGRAPGGMPSTIVDATGPYLRVLRPGAIPIDVGRPLK